MSRRVEDFSFLTIIHLGTLPETRLDPEFGEMARGKPHVNEHEYTRQENPL